MRMTLQRLVQQPQSYVAQPVRSEAACDAQSVSRTVCAQCTESDRDRSQGVP